MTKIKIRTGNPKFPITESLYGLFFEDINRSGDGGVYPEMIRNCTFEDSLIPEETTAEDPENKFFVSGKGWRGEFTHGEGLARWTEANKTPYTPIPAWYAENAEMSLDAEDTLNAKRRVSLKVKFEDGGRICNVGFQGVAAVKGRVLNFYMFAKSCCDHAVKVKLVSACGCTTYAETCFVVKSNGYSRYDASFVACEDDKDARLVIEAPEGFTLHLGFISLKPADTYNGHGLRKDLVEKLAALKPGFMRYPGGCIVEGFNPASALKFSNMIGPVWERPTDWNLWAYNTVNGFGYHEFLQLCEDLNMKKMWVFNCGMTCQGRNPYYYDEEDTRKALQECIDAIEYATAPVGTKWGDCRAAAGHPEPFGLDYVEIGNENWGPEYFKRYEFCYNELKKRYPDIVYISNTHTEKEGLATEIADEHFYSTPEFFAENIHKYDSYPRKAEGGPEIFVGEYAVTAGKPGTLKAALGEGMFLMGMERNQDVVKLASYAPLFENVSFYNWYPNLICFDNTSSYGIPSWHMLKLMGENRGTQFVDAETETETLSKKLEGVFALYSREGLRFRNVTIDGKPAAISHSILGTAREENGVFVTAAQDLPEFLGPIDTKTIAGRTRFTFGTELVEDAAYEAEIDFQGDITLQAFVQSGDFFSEFGEWNPVNTRGFDWSVSGSTSTVSDGSFFGTNILEPEKAVSLTPGWHRFRIVTYHGGFDCFIDGEVIHQVKLPSYPAVEAVADTTDDSVIVKIINFTDSAEAIDVSLDCDVESEYCLKLLAGDADAGNTIDDPENVKAVECAKSGAGKNFCYEAPANSLSVLILKKA